MKKALIISSVPSMISQFNMDNIKILKKLGYKVDVGTNFNLTGTLDKKNLEKLNQELNDLKVGKHQINFSRGIGTINENIKAYRQLKDIFAKQDYDIIHCHSPIGGVLGRIAAKRTKKIKRTKVLYTAHGFQFFKGGKVKDWILFYPIEKLLARYTDVLITINNEDFSIAEKLNSKMKVYKIPGVGINCDEYKESYSLEDRKKIKKSLGIDEQAKIIISVGELSKRKNHLTGIKSMAKLDRDVYYIICGVGDEKENLIRAARELGVEDKLIFLGYVNDKLPYYSISDIGIFLSRREGLGLAGLEMMAAGLPLISSYLGGIKDYTSDGYTGYVIRNPLDSDEVSKKIEEIITLDEKKVEKIKKNNREIARKFDKSISNSIMQKIYMDLNV